MGHNRAGVRQRARLRRRKREGERLAKKAAEPQGVVAKVKKVAKQAAEKVTEVVKAAAEKVTGKKKEEPRT